MQLQILSDLHLETTPSCRYIFPFPATAPSLALLGDIGNTRDPEYFEFLETQLWRFERVFLVLGNHEPYKSSWEAARRVVGEFEEKWNGIREKESGDGGKQRGELVFLNRRRWDWGGREKEERVTILGCTLFSKIKMAEMQNIRDVLKDFKQIKDWTVEGHLSAFEKDAEWIRNTVEEISLEDEKLGRKRKIILLTHHAPTQLEGAHDPRHKHSPIKVESAFATELKSETWWKRDGESGLRLVAFGHTHWNCDFVDEETGVRMVANQKGYLWSQIRDGGLSFDAGKVVDVKDDGWKPRNNKNQC
ncbi:hypothetical protein EX30DRAFT_338489 [Ascodesmis nigricans]|uniref:Calcineurin-like phosphoesterase domain-containing protein n=1 Tax=Ascodesmis nigricans TaxID=341454 RepID=A0A4S2N3V9_9PEZI|nr:hypothetical protein EX30DRAFT_338489 [Ascodesmis nigricans]